MTNRTPSESASRTSRLIALVPNALSLARLALAACFPLLPVPMRLPVLIVGGLSDWIDGFIARLARVQSTAGQLLDPIADKIFVLAALLTLTVDGLLFWWQALLVLTRDLAVLVVSTYAAFLRDWRAFARMTPSLTGKLTTVLIYVWLAAELARWALPATRTLFIAAAVCSALTAIEYMRSFTRELWARRTVGL